VGKIGEKAVCRNVFLTTWHFIFSAELTKTHSYRLLFGNFAHWEGIKAKLKGIRKKSHCYYKISNNLN